MCGIAGFSLHPASRINARALGHHLLTAIERRGGMASGFAYANVNGGGFSYYKDAVAGSNLPTRSMPRNAKTAIFHTRLATHGSPTVPANNHPVLSPTENIALVHNGVIWNEQSLRHGFLRDVTLPQVDSSVIPAMFEAYGTDATSELSGDAAVAWLDAADSSMLNVARIENSPMVYTWLDDGSFVMCSTAALLVEALNAASLGHGHIFIMPELRHFAVKDGVVRYALELPETKGFGYGYARSFRHATSGGHGTAPASAATPTRGTIVTAGVRPSGSTALGYSEQTKSIGPVGSTNVYGFGTGEDAADDDGDEWGQFRDTVPAVLDKTIPSVTKTDSGWDESWEDKANSVGIENGRYYTTDQDGNYLFYEELDELETDLLWTAAQSKDGILGTDETKWVNFFSDVGNIDFDGKTLISWVKNPDEIGFHEDASGEPMTYVRDGVTILQSLVGR